MKKILAILICLFLTSCITVGDYGEYWDRASIDPDLIGTWQNVSDRETPDVDTVIVTNKNGRYHFDEYFNGTKKKGKDADNTETRSLNIGPYKFFATRYAEKHRKGFTPGGDLTRYKVSGGTLESCSDNYAVAQFISTNYPNDANISVEDIPALENDASEDANKTKSIKIKTLNDEAVKIFSAIPDDETYWNCKVISKRIHD